MGWKHSPPPFRVVHPSLKTSSPLYSPYLYVVLPVDSSVSPGPGALQGHGGARLFWFLSGSCSQQAVSGVPLSLSLTQLCLHGV